MKNNQIFSFEQLFDYFDYLFYFYNFFIDYNIQCIGYFVNSFLFVLIVILFKMIERQYKISYNLIIIITSRRCPMIKIYLSNLMGAKKATIQDVIKCYWT